MVAVQVVYQTPLGHHTPRVFFVVCCCCGFWFGDFVQILGNGYHVPRRRRVVPVICSDCCMTLLTRHVRVVGTSIGYSRHAHQLNVGVEPHASMFLAPVFMLGRSAARAQIKVQLYAACYHRSRFLFKRTRGRTKEAGYSVMV